MKRTGLLLLMSGLLFAQRPFPRPIVSTNTNPMFSVVSFTRPGYQSGQQSDAGIRLNTATGQIYEFGIYGNATAVQAINDKSLILPDDVIVPGRFILISTTVAISSFYLLDQKTGATWSVTVGYGSTSFNSITLP